MVKGGLGVGLLLVREVVDSHPLLSPELISAPSPKCLSERSEESPGNPPGPTLSKFLATPAWVDALARKLTRVMSTRAFRGFFAALRMTGVGEWARVD